MSKNSNGSLPAISLADTIIFPGITSPVITVREVSKIAVTESVSNYNRSIIVATHKTPELDSATADNLYKTDVLSKILSVIPISDDVVRRNIGGLRKKLVAAQGVNFSCVILPEENRAKVESYSHEIKKQLKLIFVNNVTEVANYLFSDA